MVGGIRPSAGVVLLLLPPALLHYTINRRKLQAVRQKICAKKAKMLGGVPCAAPVRPAAVENSMGSLPRRCRRGGRQRYPAGGLPGWSPAYPAFGLLPCPLSPQPPSPAGKGETSGYFMQGASPLASPRLSRKRHLQNLPSRCPEWGFAPCGAGGIPAPGGGRGGFGRPPAFYFSFVSAPIPPPPFPAGRGRL